MRNSDCVRYAECLDRAALGRGNFNCEGCRDLRVMEEEGFRKDVYGEVHGVGFTVQGLEKQKKEASINNHKVIRLRQGYGGQEGEGIMEEKKTKVCSNPNCKHKGEPQDIGKFGKNAGCKDGYTGVCNDCKKQQYADRQKAKKNGTYVSRKGKKKKAAAVKTTVLTGGVADGKRTIRIKEGGWLKDEMGRVVPILGFQEEGQVATLDLKGKSPEAKKILLDALMDRIEAVVFSVAA